ncbi:metallophosphoesterase family protein [Candidatus Bathyarchaeota archaeon]|nr:metallophosphoesterase family protein [Candidatus Bathyarchaeota archaeon]
MKLKTPSGIIPALLLIGVLMLVIGTLILVFNIQTDEKGKPQYYLKPYVTFANPTTEMIRFETTENVNFMIEYGTTLAYGQSISNSTFGTMHEIKIAGLQPNTLYYYKVTVTDSKGECNDDFSSTFRTATNERLNFTFVVLGDSRADSGDGVDTDQFPTLINDAVNNFNPRFIIFTGDVVTTSGNEYDEIRNAWKTYTDEVENISDHIPIFSAIGNHENIRNPNALLRYREVWMHSHNGEGESGYYDELTYWFEFGKSLFIFVNTEEPSYSPRIASNQLVWLNNTLQKQGYAHKFIFFHKPICGSNRTGTVSKDFPSDATQLDQMFSENNVSVAFCGHDHYYCYNTTQSNQTYVITGGAGAPLRDNSTWAVGISFREYHYLVVNVTSTAVNVGMIDISGNVRHSFSVGD